MSIVIPSLRAAVAVPGWAKNALWRNARAVPSLDLRFADNKSLVDAVTGASLITFTRASSGTYVDSAGVLQTAATDVPRFDHSITSSTTNLLLRSEEFETIWTRTSVSGFGVGSAVNVETAPNGTLTADLIAVANGFNSGIGFVLQDITKAATSTTYTVTTFAKAQDWNAVTLHAHDVATNNNRATVTFSLATGVITTAAAAFGTFSAASAITATPFISGWFRVNLTFTSSTETGLRVRLIPNNSTTVTSDGTNGIYIWGAQLEQSATVGPYVPTTTAAATSNTTESLGLLVEESRTNLMLWSEDFSNVAWVENSATVTTNTQTAPNGTLTADTFSPTSGTSSLHQIITCLASTAYTWSFYVKLGTMAAADFRFAVRDDSNGAFIATDIVPNVTPVTTEWRRVTYTFTTPVGCVLVRPYLYRFTPATYGTTVHLWGADLQAGAFASSYIPTTTAAATRSADVASITGSNFSSWYNQTEGTVFIEGIVSPGLSSFPWFYNISDGTIDNSIGAYQFTNGIYGAVAASGTTATPNPAVLFTPVSGTAAKHAFAVKTSDTRAAYNATLSVAQTSTVMPVVSQLFIGQSLSSNRINSTIKRLVYWGQRLPNNVLQTLTQ